VARRIIIGVVCTLALLGIARRFSAGRPVDIRIDEGGYRIHHRTVTEQIGPGQPILLVRVDPGKRSAARVELDSTLVKSFPMRPFLHRDNNTLFAYIPDLGKGKRLSYAITVWPGDGTKVRLPRDPDKNFLIRYKGKVSTLAIVLHVAFMFGAFFAMFMAFLGALRILRRLEGKRGTVKAARWALVLSFIGGWPLGFILNYQTFGPLWEGYPFGYDITDNKTQLMFIFWLASLLLVWGSFIGKGEEKDRLGGRAFAWAIIVSFFVSLALFLLPHSI